MQELTFVRSGRLEWRDRAEPTIVEPTDALVRPFVASRCDGDVLPLHNHVSRPMQAALKVGVIDPVVASIVGDPPFRGPFGIGHEAIGQVTAVGAEVAGLRVGDIVVVPWAMACGTCYECNLGLTAKCSTMATQSPGKTLAAYGFGPACGSWGGMVTDSLRIPFADFNLVGLPTGLDPLRVAAASDNLADAWRAVVPPLALRPGGRVLVLGGGGRASACTRRGWRSPTAHRPSTTSTTVTHGWRSPNPSAPTRTRWPSGAGPSSWNPCPTATTWSWRRRPTRRACATRSGRCDPAASARAPATTSTPEPRSR